eukprot:403358049
MEDIFDKHDIRTDGLDFNGKLFERESYLKLVKQSQFFIQVNNICKKPSHSQLQVSIQNSLLMRIVGTNINPLNGLHILEQWKQVKKNKIDSEEILSKLYSQMNYITMKTDQHQQLIKEKKKKLQELERLIQLRDSMKSDNQVLDGIQSVEYESTVFQQTKRIEDQKENIYIIRKKVKEQNLIQQKLDSHLKIFGFKLITHLKIICTRIIEIEDVSDEWKILGDIVDKETRDSITRMKSRQMSSFKGLGLGGMRQSVAMGAGMGINRGRGNVQLMSKFRTIVRKASVIPKLGQNQQAKPSGSSLMDFLIKNIRSVKQVESIEKRGEYQDIYDIIVNLSKQIQNQKNQIQGLKSNPKYQVQKEQLSFRSSMIGTENSKLFSTVNSQGKSKFRLGKGSQKFVKFHNLLNGGKHGNTKLEDSFMSDSSDEGSFIKHARSIQRCRTAEITDRRPGKINSTTCKDQEEERPQTQSIMRQRKQAIAEKRKYLKKYVQTISNLHREEDLYLQRFKVLVDPYFTAINNPNSLAITKKSIMLQLNQMRVKRENSQNSLHTQLKISGKQQNQKSFESSGTKPLQRSFSTNQRLKLAPTKKGTFGSGLTTRNDDMSNHSQSSFQNSKNHGNDISRVNTSMAVSQSQQKKKLASMKVQKDRNDQVKEFLRDLEEKVRQKRSLREQQLQRTRNILRGKSCTSSRPQTSQGHQTSLFEVNMLQLKDIPSVSMFGMQTIDEKLNSKLGQNDDNNPESLACSRKQSQQNVLFNNRKMSIEEQIQRTRIQVYYDMQQQQRKDEKEKKFMESNKKPLKYVSFTQFLSRIEGVNQISDLDRHKMIQTSRQTSTVSNNFRSKPFLSNDFKHRGSKD